MAMLVIVEAPMVLCEVEGCGSRLGRLRIAGNAYCVAVTELQTKLPKSIFTINE